MITIKRNSAEEARFSKAIWRFIDTDYKRLPGESDWDLMARAIGDGTLTYEGMLKRPGCGKVFVGKILKSLGLQVETRIVPNRFGQNQPIVELGMSARVTKGLLNAGLDTVGKVFEAKMTGYKAMRVCRFGRKSTREVEEKFASIGIYLMWIRVNNDGVVKYTR